MNIVIFGIARKTKKSVFCYSIPLLAGLAILTARYQVLIWRMRKKHSRKIQENNRISG